MVRSYPRNNFLDILRDPLAVTIMASIGLHAVLGAVLLPIITQAQPEGKKAEPTTVKVVELTPTELQRIPQVPTPLPTPTAVTLPPVYQPSTPVAPKIPPTQTTIPTTPIRTPTAKTSTKTPQPTETPAVKSTPKSSAANFDPNIFDTPSPKPTQSPGKKGETKPSPKPTPSIKTTQPSKTVTTKPTTTPKPSPETTTNDDGGDGGQASNPSPQPSPTGTNPQPTATPTTTVSPNPSPSGTQPTANDAQAGTYYGSFAQAVSVKLQEYYAKYPNLKFVQLKPRKIAYPDKVPCSKVKQQPYVIFIPVFGKTPQNQDPNFGSTTADSEEATVFVANAAAGNKDLIDLARSIAAEEAQQADKNRAEVDKDRPVAYSTKIEFDPATCKN
jgi:hypothetical protein